MPYNLDSEKWSYIAGLFDGEGYIGLVKQKDSRYNRGGAVYYHPRISVAMTDYATVKFLLDTLNGYMYKCKKLPQHKQVYKWSARVNLAEIREIALSVLPYSITNKRVRSKPYSKNCIFFYGKYKRTSNKFHKK